MQRAFLLYNPESGRRRHRRVADVTAAATALQSSGIEVTVEPMEAPDSAARQVANAIRAGHDAVIVCGGDGSVNEVLSAVVGKEVALGVIPLGTGNGLATDLGLPRDPAKAAMALVSAEARFVAVPCLEYTQRDGTLAFRHFIVGAGVGADAYMLYRLTLDLKRRWGMAAYYFESTRQWLTHDFPLFTAEFRSGDGEWRCEQVSDILAVRITRFGGLISKLAPGASLARKDFQLVLFKTRRRASFLRYMVNVWFEQRYQRSDIEILPATECRCLPLENFPASPIYAEADGEVLGTLPAAVTIASDRVNLLVPRTAAWKSAVL